MSRANPKDRAASIRTRLLNLARKRGEDFQITLRNYLFERFLYRLSLSDVNERFILKGAMLLRLWADRRTALRPISICYRAAVTTQARWGATSRPSAWSMLPTRQ